MSTNTVSQVNIATQKLTVEAVYLALINGFNTDLVGMDPVVLIGTSYARADLLAKFQNRVDASRATKAARAALRSAVASEKGLDAELEPLRSAIKQFLQSRSARTARSCRGSASRRPSGRARAPTPRPLPWRR